MANSEFKKLMSSIRIFNTPNDFLDKKQKSPKNDSTHVSSLSMEKYRLIRSNIEKFWDLYGKEYTTTCQSVLESDSQFYSMFRVDVDKKLKISKHVKKPYPLYTKDEVLSLVEQIQQYFRNNIQNCTDEMLHCAVLTKEPYIKVTEKESFIKNGFHLQFINCFLNKDNFKDTEEHFQKEYGDTYDCIRNKAWLLYGAQKDESSGRYLVEYVLDESLEEHKPEEYFKNYDIYDTDENIIQKTGDMEYYYPRIFSILPFGRKNICDFIVHTHVMPSVMKNIDYGDRAINLKEFEQYQEDIMTIIDEFAYTYFDNNVMIKVNDDNRIFLNRINTKISYPCPLNPIKSHYRRSGCLFINDGSIYYTCSNPNCCTDDGKRRILVGRFREKTVDKSSDEVVTKMTNARLDYLFNIQKKEKEDIYDEFVDHTLLNCHKKCVIIKAGLGRGKSTAVSKYITENTFKRIIVLTPRITYAQSIKERLESSTGMKFVLYRDEKKRYIDTPNLIIQAESLHRINIPDDETDILIILDEVESFLTQLTCTETHADNMVNNITMFQDLMTRSKKILYLDAFISRRTINIMYNLNIKFVMYDYVRPLNKRKAVQIGTYQSFLKNLVTDLKDGKKIYLFSSSKGKLTKMIEYLEQNVLIDDRKIVLKQYHGDKKDKIGDVNENWKNVDIVCTTSTITVGINFDTMNVFNKIYTYVSATSKNLVRDIFQSTYRIRHLIDNEMMYYLDTRHIGMNLPLNRKDIKDSSDLKKKLIREQFESYTKVKYGNETPLFLEELYLYNIFEQNMSIMMLEKLFNRYLLECNYEICDGGDDDDLEDIDFDSFIDNVVDYSDIKNITDQEFKDLKIKQKREVLTLNEKMQLKKHCFQKIIKDTTDMIEMNLWELYKEVYKIAKFDSVRNQFGVNEGCLRIYDIVNSSKYDILANTKILRLEMLLSVCKELGIKYTEDYGKKIKRESIERIGELLQNKEKDIEVIFSLRNRSTKKDEKYTLRRTLEVLNQMFDKSGFASIKMDKNRVRKMVDGKRVDVSDYVIVNTLEDKDIDIRKYLVPKKYKQTIRHVLTEDENRKLEELDVDTED